MTDHTTAAQAAMQEAVLTGDEIRRAVAIARSMNGPSDATQPGEYVLAGALALLSKLRAPVAREAISDLEALLWAEKHGLQWALKYPDEIREVIADAQRLVVPQASALAAEYARGRADGFDAAKAAPQASEAVREQCSGNIVELAEAVVEAHDSMFAQCCSNPVRNAWGDEVSMLALNQAYELARAALFAQPGPQTEAPHDDRWTPEQLAAIESQGPTEPFEISLIPITYPVLDEIADPCPQCVSGAVCKTPTCGRLIAHAPGKAEVMLPPMPHDVGYAVRRIRRCEDEAAAQVALERFANGHARAAVLADRQQRAGSVSPTLLASTHMGMRVDYRGLLRQAREALGAGSALAEMLRQLQEHLLELGQRWYSGDTAVVDELLQLYCVEPEARAAQATRRNQQKAGVSDA